MNRFQGKLEIRQAKKSDLNGIKSLLESVSLPSADIDNHISNFLLLECDGNIAGTVGMEMYGETALLRSLAIQKEFQKKGYGRKLCNKLLSDAGIFNVKNVYLLTETAKDFFSREGFQIISREAVPEEIKRTYEYTTLCPSDSTCMVKKINE